MCYIFVDKFGKMIILKLVESIEVDIKEGFILMMVNVIVGIIVLGVFDDILFIFEICKKYIIWFYVDGVYCGLVLFSNKYKYLIKGVEKVDFFSFNVYKMIGIFFICLLFLVKEK